MKIREKIKKVSVLCLIFLLSINNFAAIVSDNDGSAFVTKAEFDALKKDFNKQIDDYNNSIDGKIDGAIASYLTGIKLTTTQDVEPYQAGLIWSISDTYRPRYKYAPPQLYGDDMGFNWTNSMSLGHDAWFWGWQVTVANKLPFNDETYGQSKLWIKNLDKTKMIAAWDCYDVGAKDEVDITHTTTAEAFSWSTSWSKYFQVVAMSLGYIYEDMDLNGQLLLRGANTTSLNKYEIGDQFFYYNSIKNHYGKSHMQNSILLNSSVAYDCFSNKDETKNWGYKGTHEDLKQIWNHSAGKYLNNDIKYMFNTGGNSLKVLGMTAPTTNINRTPKPVGAKNTGNQIVSTEGYYETTYADRQTYTFKDNDIWYWRGAGFETKYLTNFNQLYNPNLDSLALLMKKETIKGHTSLMLDSASNPHIGLVAGFPIVQLKKDQSLKMDLGIKDISIETDKTNANYGNTLDDATFKKMIVWAKTSPFTTDDPNSEADLEITGRNVTASTTTGCDKGYVLQRTGAEPVNINIQVPENCIVWLKWSKDDKNGGGVIEIPETINVISPD